MNVWEKSVFGKEIRKQNILIAFLILVTRPPSRKPLVCYAPHNKLVCMSMSGIS